jgi:hypothetical protein
MEPTPFPKWWFELNLLDVGLSFAINMIAVLFAFLLGVFFRRIPHSWREFRVHQFWGWHNVAVCHGSLQTDRSVCRDSPFVKIFRDGRTIRISGPSENVMGDSEIRSSTYLVRELSRYWKRLSVEADNARLAELDRTIVALGSDSSNEMTRLILREPNNRFLEFAQEKNLLFIHDKRTDEKFVGFQPPTSKDYGMILKIANTRFPGKFFFVCAGLGDWGTSGASWFLACK